MSESSQVDKTFNIIMRKLFTILLSLCFFIGYSQSDPKFPPVGHIPIKGEGYFLLDANGKIITTIDGGALVIINVADTATSTLVQPPDTAGVFDITMVNPGDVSTPGLANGVQAYWSFEETAGATAFDSAASYDGDLINTPTQSETGISNLCYSFASASEEWIDFGTSFLDPGTDDVAVMGWINPSSLGISQGIVGNYGTDEYCTCDKHHYDNQTCPFAEDINDDSDTMCNCCPYCEQECAWDI